MAAKEKWLPYSAELMALLFEQMDSSSLGMIDNFASKLLGVFKTDSTLRDFLDGEYEKLNTSTKRMKLKLILNTQPRHRAFSSVASAWWSVYSTVAEGTDCPFIAPVQEAKTENVSQTQPLFVQANPPATPGDVRSVRELSEELDDVSVLSRTVEAFVSKLLTLFPRDPSLNEMLDEGQFMPRSGTWWKVRVKQWLFSSGVVSNVPFWQIAKSWSAVAPGRSSGRPVKSGLSEAGSGEADRGSATVPAPAINAPAETKRVTRDFDMDETADPPPEEADLLCSFYGVVAKRGGNAALVDASAVWQTDRIVFQFVNEYPSPLTGGVVKSTWTRADKDCVKVCMLKWTHYNGRPRLAIQFVELEVLPAEERPPKADVRIARLSRQWNSEVGTLAQDVPDGTPTAFFATDLSKKENERHILHELGHMLGLRHEHQSDRRILKFNTGKLKDYCKAKGWDEKTIQDNILTTIKTNAVAGPAYDALSIMHYQFPPQIFDPPFALPANTGISRGDYETVSDLYTIGGEDKATRKADREAAAVKYAARLNSLDLEATERLRTDFQRMMRDKITVGGDFVRNVVRDKINVGGDYIVMGTVGGSVNMGGISKAAGHLAHRDINFNYYINDTPDKRDSRKRRADPNEMDTVGDALPKPNGGRSGMASEGKDEMKDEEGVSFCSVFDTDGANPDRTAAALADCNRFWTKPRIVYQFVGSPPWSTGDKAIVDACMSHWTDALRKQRLGIEFVNFDDLDEELPSAPDMRFMKNTGRWGIDFAASPRRLSVYLDSLEEGNDCHILHMLGHVLGLKHEHKAKRNVAYEVDLDLLKQYNAPEISTEVLRNNIVRDLRNTLEMNEAGYDARSVMHMWFSPKRLVTKPKELGLPLNRKVSQAEQDVLANIYPLDGSPAKRKAGILAYVKSLRGLAETEFRDVAAAFTLS